MTNNKLDEIKVNSPLPTFISPSVVAIDLRENASEHFPKLAWDSFKMFEDKVYLINKENRRPMYAINLTSGAAHAVDSTALAQEERFQNHFNAWMENTEYALIKHLRVVRSKFTDFKY